jgi:hypothetical protein
MKRLGVWLPRWNHLKTLLPVMAEAWARDIEVSVLCPFPPMMGPGKPELRAEAHMHELAHLYPWAQWSMVAQMPGSWPFTVMIAHGVVHNGDIISRSGIPWIALDHLMENAWWYLTGRPDLWEPWHRVCLSGLEALHLPDEAMKKTFTTGYTGLGCADTAAEARATYGLPDRYMLVSTGIRPAGMGWAQWTSYAKGGRWLLGYRGATYREILETLKRYCKQHGLAMVGKMRWKDPAHPAHRLFDYTFGDNALDPYMVHRLMIGATCYASSLSGIALEAAAARVPGVNWSYYDPVAFDRPGFRKIRQEQWVDGLWAGQGITDVSGPGWRETLDRALSSLRSNESWPWPTWPIAHSEATRYVLKIAGLL